MYVGKFPRPMNSTIAAHCEQQHLNDAEEEPVLEFGPDLQKDTWPRRKKSEAKIYL